MTYGYTSLNGYSANLQNVLPEIKKEDVRDKKAKLEIESMKLIVNQKYESRLNQHQKEQD